MTTLNHDTELEEILNKLGRDYDTPYRLMHDKDKSPIEQLPLARAQLMAETQAALHTYLYKQTLELIENAPVVGIIGSKGIRSERIDKAQLRKAAAERWGQE